MAHGATAAALAAALALSLAATIPAPALAQGEGGTGGGGSPAVRLGERLTIEPFGLFQYDLGTPLAADRPGAPSGGSNPRRARLGVEGEAGEDVSFGLVWDFGGSPGSRSRLYDASLTWRGPLGLRPLALQAGVFKPQFSLEEVQSSSDTLFLERASAVSLASGLAAGDYRTAAEARLGGREGDRWLAGAALTGGTTGPGGDSRQRGATARVAGLARRAEDTALHLGASALWVLRAPRDGAGRPAISLSDGPELELDRRDPPLSTGPIRAGRARAVSAEAGFSAGRLWVQGEWVGLAVDEEADAARGRPGGTRDASGWYAQAAYVLAGRPRRWDPSRAAWGAPGPEGGIPVLGAVEVGARVSTADLGDLGGGRQRVLTAGVSLFPTERLRLTFQGQHVEVRGGEGGDRRFGALALRLQASL